VSATLSTAAAAAATGLLPPFLPFLPPFLAMIEIRKESVVN
jgi:hypothetical protein